MAFGIRCLGIGPVAAAHAACAAAAGPELNTAARAASPELSPRARACLARSISSRLVQRTLRPSRPALAVNKVPEREHEFDLCVRAGADRCAALLVLAQRGRRVGGALVILLCTGLGAWLRRARLRATNRVEP